MKIFPNTDDDSERDRERYERANLNHLANDLLDLEDGYESFPIQHTPPFAQYYKEIEKFLIPKESKIRVLEIGAGNGQHTKQLLTSKTEVTALDISESSLAIIEKKFNGLITTVIGNIECLPFESDYFDLIVSAGALSYGEPKKVDSEIFRVLKMDGAFIFIDSLNHNWIYRANRFFRFMRGNRTLSTVLRIPDLVRVEEIGFMYKKSYVSYFGAWLWIFPLFRFTFGRRIAIKINGWLETLPISKRNAFKIVARFEGKKTHHIESGERIRPE